MDPDPCAVSTRAHARWARFWAVYAAATFGVGVVGDTWAQTRHGYPATLTCFLRRTMGIEPRTRYERAGQAAMGLFLTWAAVHLTTGWLGPSKDRTRP